MFSKVFTSKFQLRIILRSSKVTFLEQARSDDFRKLSLTVFRLLKVEISPKLTLQPFGPTHENWKNVIIYIPNLDFSKLFDILWYFIYLLAPIGHRDVRFFIPSFFTLSFFPPSFYMQSFQSPFLSFSSVLFSLKSSFLDSKKKNPMHCNDYSIFSSIHKIYTGNSSHSIL